MSPASTRLPFVLDKTEVLPGQSKRMEVPISTLSTGTVLTVPVVVVHGRQNGPTLLVSAAIHGDEINGIEIVRRFLSHVKAARLRGTVIAVPIVNVFGYLNRSRYLPDHRDLNRSFPGSAKGSLASQMAHWFLNDIVSRCDVAVDLHTGSDGRANLPQIRCNLNDHRAADLGLAFGAPAVVNSSLRPNSLRAAAAARHLPMLVYEGGESLRFDQPTIEIGVRGLRQMLVCLDMQGQAELVNGDDTFVAQASTWVRVKRGGVWHTEVGLGQMVEVGQSLGKVTDIYGKVRSRCNSAYAGKVVGMSHFPNVSRGDAVLHIAVQHPIRKREEVE